MIAAVLWLAAALALPGRCGAGREAVGGSVPDIDGQEFTATNCLMNIDNLFIEEGSVQARTEHGFSKRLRLLAGAWDKVRAARRALPATVLVGDRTYYTSEPGADCNDYGDHFHVEKGGLAAAAALVRGQGGAVIIDDILVVGLTPNASTTHSRALFVVGSKIFSNSSSAVDEMLSEAGIGGVPLQLSPAAQVLLGETRFRQKVVITSVGGIATAQLVSEEELPAAHWCRDTILSTVTSYQDTCLDILSDNTNKMIRFSGILGQPRNMGQDITVNPKTALEIKAISQFTSRPFILSACGRTDRRILATDVEAEGSGGPDGGVVDPGLLGCAAALYSAHTWQRPALVRPAPPPPPTQRKKRWSLMGFLFGNDINVGEINSNIQKVTRNQEELLIDEQNLLNNEHKLETFVDVLFDKGEEVADQMNQLSDQISLHSYMIERVNQAHTNNAQQIRALLSVAEFYYRVLDLEEGVATEISKLTGAMVGGGDCHQHAETDHLVCRRTHATLSLTGAGEVVSSSTGTLLGRRPVITPNCLPRADATIMSKSGETFLYQGSSGNLVNPELGSVLPWDCATNASRCKTTEGAYTELTGPDRDRLHFIAGDRGFWVGSSYSRRLSDSKGGAIDVKAGIPVHLTAGQFPIQAGKTRYSIGDVTDIHHRTVLTRKYVENVQFDRVDAAMGLAREVGDLKDFKPGQVDIEDLTYNEIQEVDPIIAHGISLKWALGLSVSLIAVVLTCGIIVRWKYKEGIARARQPSMFYTAGAGGDGGAARAGPGIPPRRSDRRATPNTGAGAPGFPEATRLLPPTETTAPAAHILHQDAGTVRQQASVGSATGGSAPASIAAPATQPGPSIAFDRPANQEGDRDVVVLNSVVYCRADKASSWVRWLVRRAYPNLIPQLAGRFEAGIERWVQDQNINTVWFGACCRDILTVLGRVDVQFDEANIERNVQQGLNAARIKVYKSNEVPR